MKYNSIEWPPLLNLANDRPHIDSTFRNVEKCNVPLIDGMLKATYREVLDGKSVYDKDGHRYTVVDGTLYRDDEELFHVGSHKFMKDTVSWDSYLAYDIDSAYDGSDTPSAYAVLNGSDNTVTVHYGDLSVTTEPLFLEGHIITCRMRIMNDVAVFVAYYDVNDIGKVLYCKLSSDGSVAETFDAVWCQQTVRTSPSDTYTVTTTSAIQAEPLVQMMMMDNGNIGVSLVSNYGYVLNSKDTYFMTFIESNGSLYHYGRGLAPDSSTATAEVTTEHNAYFTTRQKRQRTNVSGSFLLHDGTYYDYTEEGVVGPELPFPTTYQPAATHTDYVTIDGISYDYGTWQGMKYTTTLIVTDSPYPATLTATDASDVERTLSITDDSYGSLVWERIYYAGETVTNTSFKTLTVVWEEATESTTPGNTVLLNWTETTTSEVGWLTAPNIFLDNGKMYSLWTFNVSATSWAQQLSVGSVLVESADIGATTNDGTTMTYSFTPHSYHTVTNDGRCPRMNSFSVGQNFWQTNVKLNNTSTTVPSSRQAGTAESTSSRYIEYLNTNVTDLLYYPGTVRATSSALNCYYNYWISLISPSTDIASGPAEDILSWTVAGFRSRISDKFHLLYNTTISGISGVQGISYADGNAMGTLLAPWSSVVGYVVANDSYIIWTDVNGQTYRVRVTEGTDMSFILDRYVIVNTTEFWNCYDTVLQKKLHYSTDYNGRLIHGNSDISLEPAVDGTVSYIYRTADGINPNYNITPRLAVSSLVLPSVSMYRCDVEYDNVYGCVCPESRDVQGIDVYYSNMNPTSSNDWTFYRRTVLPYVIPSVYKNISLDSTTWTITSTSGTLLSPNIFTEYIDGQGNHDGVVDGSSNYVLTYNTAVSQPQFLYSASTETISQEAFFVLQGQFYGVMDNKIWSLVYSNGVITNKDAIVDIDGMHFIGNNPMIAFFWSPSLRSVYSFTGDANLQHLYYADKFTDIHNKKHFYDESTQSIYVPTDSGLLVFGPKNIYFHEDLTDVSDVTFSNDGTTHIVNGNKTVNQSYFPRDGYTANKTVIETSFYGLGNREVTGIPRWSVTLYSLEPKDTDIVVSVRSLTDITVASEDKVLKIHSNDWDKWSHSALVNINPKLIRAQGIRLSVTTDCDIQSIAAAVDDRKTGQTTKNML